MHVLVLWLGCQLPHAQGWRSCTAFGTRMNRTRIKFCGMTRAEDVQLACALGVDALGFIFAPRSTRLLRIAEAAELTAQVPPLVHRIGLFVDPDPELVHAALESAGIDVLQFHGEESPAFCAQFGAPWIKAIGMNSKTPPEAVALSHTAAWGFVLDAHGDGGAGGRGVTFDWTRVPASVTHPILAGGLDPENVFDAVTAVRPWAVDVASGIESAPGCKDAALMRRFVQQVKRADDAS